MRRCARSMRRSRSSSTSWPSASRPYSSASSSCTTRSPRRTAVLGQRAASIPAPAPATLRQRPSKPSRRTWRPSALEAQRREQAAVATESAPRRTGARELDLRSRAGPRRERQPCSPRASPPAVLGDDRAGNPTDARLTELDARLAELRDAEALFLRTRDELAGRSEAVAARERLVAQRERELDDREDGKGQWASPELSEMEARLRRLEQQQPGEQTLGFSGGFRKLEQGSRPQRGG